MSTNRLRGAIGTGVLVMLWAFSTEIMEVVLIQVQNGVSFQIGEDTVVREKFINDGELDGTIDDTPRAVQDRW